MSSVGWTLVALAPALTEIVITWLRPEWLTVLPSWSIADHTFSPRNPKRLASDGYRDAPALAPLSAINESTELTGAVLVARVGRIVLRRWFGGRRAVWVVKIEVQRSGETVTLRARQIVTPFTLPLSMQLVAVANDLTFFWVLSVVAVWASLTLLEIKGRDVALQEAFRFLEEEMRAELERR